MNCNPYRRDMLSMDIGLYGFHILSHFFQNPLTNKAFRNKLMFNNMEARLYMLEGY